MPPPRERSILDGREEAVEERLARALHAIGRVRDVVLVPGGAAAGPTLDAYLVVDTTREELTDRHVREWALVFEHRYRGRFGERPADDFAGWRSSFTGQPISRREMVDWLSGAVRRLRSLHPRNVLEIGCGTGLVARRLIGAVDSYVAADPSEAAVERLGRDPILAGATRFEALHRPAHVWAGLPRDRDLVILNSVVQYFPSAGYLRDVVEIASRHVIDGGHVFIGDVRNLALAPLHYAEASVARSRPQVRVGELASAVRLREHGEQELLLDPRWFLELRRWCSDVTHVAVRPRAGRLPSEMNRYRYDVTLSIRDGAAVEPGESIHWGRDVRSVDDLVRVRSRARTPVLVAGIPNRWLSRGVRAWHAIHLAPGRTVRELRERLRLESSAGLAPPDLDAAGASGSPGMDARWEGCSSRGHFAALLVPAPFAGRAIACPPGHAAAPPTLLSTEPALTRLARGLARPGHDAVTGVLDGRDLPWARFRLWVADAAASTLRSRGAVTPQGGAVCCLAIGSDGDVAWPLSAAARIPPDP